MKGRLFIAWPSAPLVQHSQKMGQFMIRTSVGKVTGKETGRVRKTSPGVGNRGGFISKEKNLPWSTGRGFKENIVTGRGRTRNFPLSAQIPGKGREGI